MHVLEKMQKKMSSAYFAHLPPAIIGNSINASKVNRIYLKWVKYFISNVLSLALKIVKEFARVLSKSPAPFTLVGKASALTCGSLIPKMCEPTSSVTQKMQVHIWRHHRQCWSAKREHFPSHCSWMTRGDHLHLSELGG